MKTKPELWGDLTFEEKKITFWHVGELGVWLDFGENEIRLTSKRPVQSGKSPKAPKDLNWLRWAFNKKTPKLTISPLLPDKPVVVKMEEPFYLSPRRSAELLIQMPVWIQISFTGSKKPVTLLEAATIELSKTWFGSFTNGELCYWLNSSARHDIANSQNQSHLALVTCRLYNPGADTLLIEKLCLQMEHLSIFEYDGMLLTDQLHVNYRGGNEISQVRTSGKPPNEFSQAKLINTPRVPGSKTLAARTFAPLRNLPGLGIPSDWK